MSLRSVLFGLYYIQYGFLVYTSFLASANLQLQHFPSKDVLKALFMSNIRVIIHSCLKKNVPKLQSPASRTEKVSDSTFTWFLISSLFGTEVWDSVDSLNISSAFFLNARSRSVTCEDDGVVTCHMTSWHADTESLWSVRQGRHSERGAARSSWSGRACTRLLFSCQDPAFVLTDSAKLKLSSASLCSSLLSPSKTLKSTRTSKASLKVL